MTYQQDLRPQDLGPNAPLIGVAGSRDKLATPALLIDLNALEHNLSVMATYCRTHDLALRPHFKTHKCPQIAKMQIEAGAIGVCAATLREIQTLLEANIFSVHLTSPLIGATKLQALAKLLTENPKAAASVSVCVDHLDGIDALEAALQPTGLPLNVLVDVDLGSMYRSGVQDAVQALALAERLQASKTLNFKGIQFYSGIIQHITKAEERSQFYAQQTDKLAKLIDLLRLNNLAPEIVSGGGTGTFPLDAESDLFTENQAGSYLFMDVEYCTVEYSNTVSQSEAKHPFEIALLLQTSVVSNNARGIVTTDAGYKSLSTDGPTPQIYSGAPEGAIYNYFGDEFGMLILGQNAEDVSKIHPSSANNDAEPASTHEIFYSTFKALKGHPGEVPLGTKIELVTPHCDPTVNLHNYFHCVRGDTLVDIWPIAARGTL